MKKTIQHSKFTGLLHSFHKNRKGVAAVEFAFIMPILLTLYLGTVEISGAISVNKRVARVASTVADLVTQQTEINKTELNAMLDIGAAIMFPYNAQKPVITIIGVEVDSSHAGGGKVVWSRRYNKGSFDGGLAVNSLVDVPTKLEIDGTFLVKVIAEVEYRPLVSWVIGSKTDGAGNSYTALDMDEEYWLRPRLSDTVKCLDC